MFLIDKSIEQLKGIIDEDMLSEDYAYVLCDAHDAGIKKVECEVYCEGCDKEQTVLVHTSSFEWTCPECKKTQQE